MTTNITSAQWTSADKNTIKVTHLDGSILFVPPDPANSDYAALLASGVTIADAPAPPPISLPDYSAAARYAKETGGITVNGAKIATDRASQAMISGAYSYAQSNPNATISFKAASGFVSLTAAQMIAIGQAVATHVQTCFSTEASIASAIAASTITTTSQIDQQYAAITA